jgi:hypothetical protein
MPHTPSAPAYNTAGAPWNVTGRYISPRLARLFIGYAASGFVIGAILMSRALGESSHTPSR